MERKQMYVEDFKRRLDEAGVKYTMSERPDGMHNIEVVFKEKESELQWRRDTLAVQGLIYHFLNRRWIVDDNYTFIMQNNHTVLFNTENVQ